MDPWYIGDVTLYPFGAGMALAGLAALLFAGWQMGRQGLKKSAPSLFAVLCVPLCLLLARVGFCLANLDYIMSMEDWGLFLRPGEGGLLPYGMLLGGLIAAWITARLTGQKAGSVSDCAAVPACLVLFFWRVLEGMSGHGRGMDLETWFGADFGNSLFHPEDLTFWHRFPFAMRDYYGEWSWAVYVLEALLALAIAFVLLCTRVRRAGGRTALLFLLYAVTQIVCESMRRGDVLRWGFVRINQIISAVVILLVLFLSATALPRQVRVRTVCRSLLQVLAGASIVMLMEFALEKKVTLIEFIPSDICYVIMIAACAWMALAVLPVWRKKYQ